MNEDKKGKACLEVLRHSYHRVYFELRFLEQALFRLAAEESEQIFFGSDGEKLHYNREYLLKRYLQAPEAVSCDYLHTVVHCLYQHPFQAYQWAGGYWDLASDIAVADVLREMDVPWITQQLPQECLGVADQIKREVPIMSAPHIARFLESESGNGGRVCGYRYADLERLFQRDSHECWSSRGGGRKKDMEEDAAGETQPDQIRLRRKRERGR